MRLQVAGHRRIRGTHIQKDDTNQNTQKGGKAKAGAKCRHVASKIVNFAPEEKADLRGKPWGWLIKDNVFTVFPTEDPPAEVLEEQRQRIEGLERQLRELSDG